MTRSAAASRTHAGFTLVEVLVALTIMAVLAGLAWRGLDGMLRAREGTKVAFDRSLRIQTVVLQFEQDVNAMFETPLIPGPTFDGQTFRLVRRVPGGVAMVAWAPHAGVLKRWTGPVVTRAAELQESWIQSQQLQGGEPGQLALLEGVTLWDIKYVRGGALVNAQSTGEQVVAPTPQPPVSAVSGAAGAGTGATPAPPVVQRETWPEGLRLELALEGRSLVRVLATPPHAP